tara:strand:+ start:250 stop:459 length:210 start_codon:yes stop_codon:yes gene_type:complete
MKVGNSRFEDLYRADGAFMTGKTVEIQLIRNVKKKFSKGDSDKIIFQQSKYENIKIISPNLIKNVKKFF